METLISQGAEAKVYIVDDFLGRPAVIKERLSKKYRHPDLDRRINKLRVVQEARCMAKCKKLGVPCPSLYFIPPFSADGGGHYRIYMELLRGCTLKHLIWHLGAAAASSGASTSSSSSAAAAPSLEPVPQQLPLEVGRVIARLHGHRVVHGDLTTSNVMVRSTGAVAATAAGAGDDAAVLRSVATDVSRLPLRNAFLSADSLPAPPPHAASAKSQTSQAQHELSVATTHPALAPPAALPVEVLLIDFGLGKMQASVEDMAVDLYVLERAFVSTHPGRDAVVADVLRAYAALCVHGPAVMAKLEAVRQRGRKRDMIG